MITSSQDEMYTNEFKRQFLQDGFYAKPMNTKIYLTIDNQTIVGNSVVMNLEESNEKIPVYSYNSDLYVKHLNGKKIITGYIALRKVTISMFLSLIKVTGDLERFEQELAQAKSNLSELNNIANDELTSEDDKQYRLLRNIYLNKIRDIEDTIFNLNRIKDEGEAGDMFEIDSNVSEILKNDNLLYYSDMYKDKEITMKVVFEGNLQNQIIGVKDLLFVKKQTEINIQKNDIVEVYQFIGNPAYGG